MNANRQTPATRRVLSGGAILVALGMIDAAAAQETSTPAGPERAIHASVETRDFGADYGTLNSATVEYKIEDGGATIVANAVAGELKGRFDTETAVGAGVTFYQRFDGAISTRTRIAVAESEPVFARLDLAQDITFGLARATTMTFGARWADYAEGGNVYFLSAGLRYYFAGGSVGYRASYVDPEDRDVLVAHLVNLSLNDATGRGRTQLWFSAGSTSLETQLADDFAGEDYGVFIRRVQPLNDTLNITGSFGLASYDRLAGRDTGTTIGLGIEVDLQ